ncbi:phage terminase large subunit family protein [Rhizosaccharibacter radicis]|uniref:Phage terminase large subunit family protein n=1 Tax=Rhizosaccharibacter radicis TaxID=2782605 RepID=A0ABT1VW19_9PROT|nr:phage terminase large subunit family protein [Acetobacteraceae bacterium KSS12]
MSTSTSLSLENHKLISPPATGPLERLRMAARRGTTPPPRISVPDWADRFRKLAREAGSTSGDWRTSTVEIARGPMLAVTEPGVHVLTVMCCTQLMKTALLENVFGFFAHLDPCPMLLLQPKEAAAEQFSKERIAPMVRTTPVLRKLVGTSKTRNADETLLFKAFPGGFLALAGAGSPDNLARRPIRVLLSDEVDKYPVTREGDPIMLAEERTATFGANWLSLRACSPTVEGESRIEKSYELSDQRQASVECPHCQHRLFLDFFRHVHWEKKDGQHLTKTARIWCEACGVAWSEGDRLRALRTVRWHQARAFECCGERQNPLDTYERSWRDGAADPIATAWDWWSGDRWAVYRARCAHCGCRAVDNTHAGFQGGKLFSPWPKDKPSDIAQKWIDAQGDEDRKQAWWNTQAGRPYRPNTTKLIAVDALAARAEHWVPGVVPDGVCVITVGIDTQDYRLEAEVVGWGRNEESWSIAYEVFDGDLSQPGTVNALDHFLKRIWLRADGRGFEVMAVCIDSGGHHTQAVYEFSKKRLGRRVWAIKGESARNGQRNPVWPAKRPTTKTKAAFRPVIIGTNAAKDTVTRRLGLTVLEGQAAPAGYMHFPADRDLNYYAQLTAERIVTKEAGGRKYRVWEQIQGRANEALDCRVYAYAALCGLLQMGLKLNQRAEEAARSIRPPKQDAAATQEGGPIAGKPVRILAKKPAARPPATDAAAPTAHSMPVEVVIASPLPAPAGRRSLLSRFGRK